MQLSLQACNIIILLRLSSPLSLPFLSLLTYSFIKRSFYLCHLPLLSLQPLTVFISLLHVWQSFINLLSIQFSLLLIKYYSTASSLFVCYPTYIFFQESLTLRLDKKKTYLKKLQPSSSVIIFPLLFVPSHSLLLSILTKEGNEYNPALCVCLSGVYLSSNMHLLLSLVPLHHFL